MCKFEEALNCFDTILLNFIDSGPCKANYCSMMGKVKVVFDWLCHF